MRGGQRGDSQAKTAYDPIGSEKMEERETQMRDDWEEMEEWWDR